MFCPKCGTQSNNAAQFCANCGNSFVSNTGATATEPAPVVQTLSAAATAETIPSTTYGAPSAQMSFGTAIATCMSKFVDFNGRATRAEYWWFYLFTVLVSWASLLVDQSGTISAILNLIFFLPVLAAGARRLHDTNRSGWWQLISITVIGLIPLIIWMASEGDHHSNNFGDPV